VTGDTLLRDMPAMTQRSPLVSPTGRAARVVATKTKMNHWPFLSQREVLPVRAMIVGDLAVKAGELTEPMRPIFA
jgi:hypothetical protein